MDSCDSCHLWSCVLHMKKKRKEKNKEEKNSGTFRSRPANRGTRRGIRCPRPAAPRSLLPPGVFRAARPSRTATFRGRCRVDFRPCLGSSRYSPPVGRPLPLPAHDGTRCGAADWPVCPSRGHSSDSRTFEYGNWARVSSVRPQGPWRGAPGGASVPEGPIPANRSRANQGAPQTSTSTKIEWRKGMFLRAFSK